jgi:hypothetical protein
MSTFSIRERDLRPDCGVIEVAGEIDLCHHRSAQIGHRAVMTTHLDV